MFKINKKRYKLLATLGLLTIAGVIVGFGQVLAQSVLQGYTSEENLQKGMLIALKDGDDSKIVAITDQNVDKFKGVVVDKNDSPVTISNEERNIFVASVGPYEVLVTNENGPIKRGDYISISSSSGIGAKALENQEYVIGVAASDFNGGGDSVSSATSKSGTTVQVGRIKADVALAKNPNMKAPQKDRIPDAIQRLSRAIADKPVSNVRIYIGMAIFVASALIAGTMLYSGVRNTLISIGRNPLSKASIYRGLFQVILLSLIIFIVGIFGVYLLLKL
jgi:hypothetical protein